MTAPPLDVLINLTFKHAGKRTVRGYCRSRGFKNGAQRIEFEWLEGQTRWYWLKNVVEWTAVRVHRKRA